MRKDDELRCDLTQLQQSHADLQLAQEELQQEQLALQHKISLADVQCSVLQEAKDMMEEELVNVKAEGQTLEQDHAKRQAEGQTLQQQLQTLQQQLMQEDQGRAMLEAHMTQIQDDKAKLQVQITQVEEDKGQLMAQRDSQSHATTQLSTQIAVLKSQVEGLRLERISEALARETERQGSMQIQLEKQMLASRLEELQIRADKAEDRARSELASANNVQHQAETRMADLNMQLQLSLVAVSSAKDDARSMADKIEAMQQAKYEATEKLAVLNAEYTTFKAMSQNPTQIADQLRQVLDFEKTKAAAQCRVEAAQEDAQENKELLSRLREQVCELEAKLVVAENVRRSLHNQMQELKGNIRIFTRVRPGAEPAMLLGSDGEVEMSLNDATHKFKFDLAFAQSSSQEDVFGEVSQFVQSAVDGYNVSLFAYGQTGSGKTHTMFGSGSDVGIIPRSMDQILVAVAHQQEQGWTYELHASFIEVYQESVRCLLTAEKDREGKNYRIVAAAHGRHIVTDVEEMSISSRQDLDELIEIANSNKTVAKTDMNSRSSRSHTVFTLSICGVKKGIERSQQTYGTLHLVDLAGSERLDKSNAVGVQLKEAQAINKSLSALSDVFVALSKKSAHVPYRNSKLTFLLQPCLSGDGKALVIANLAPESSSAHESLCTLRFASMVSSCELGKAVKHTSISSVTSSAPAATRSVCSADDMDSDEGQRLVATPRNGKGPPASSTPCKTSAATPTKKMGTPAKTSGGGLRRLSRSCDDIATLAATPVATPSRTARPNTPGAAGTPRLPPSGLKMPALSRTPSARASSQGSRIPPPAKR